VIKTPHKIAFFGPARDGRVQRCIQHELGLLKCRQLVKVAQELKKSQIAWQVGFADATKHPQVRLEQGKQALGPVFMGSSP
jgi:hypothetical protein